MREGTVRVLARLQLPPGAGDAPTQIANVQNQLLAELRTSDAELIRRYETLPLLALRVNEAGLCRLLTSPLVNRVDPDAAGAPGT